MVSPGQDTHFFPKTCLPNMFGRAAIDLTQNEVRDFLRTLKVAPDVTSSDIVFEQSRLNESPSDRVRPDVVRKILIRNGFQFPKEAARLSFLMCKGGVGKTTIAYFLGLNLAAFGARVLYVDSDPQANLTMTLRKLHGGFELNDQTPVVADVLSKRVRIDRTIIPILPNLHLVPSTAVNSVLERVLLTTKNPLARLDQALLGLRHSYDYILIDCAPSLNIFNASVAYASDHMIAPFQLNEFSRLGLQQTIREIGDLEKTYGFKTDIKIVLNAFRGLIDHEGEFLDQVAEQQRSQLMKSYVHQSSDIQIAINSGGILDPDSSPQARGDFIKLASEVMTSLGSRHG